MTRTHPGSTLTEEEHQARAMLMGRVYDWRDGTYSVMSSDGDVSNTDMLDADTLQPISMEDGMQRMRNWNTTMSIR